jgi:glycosyltransferase involved in cell wall biosynthesis/GT2 family glycosyltransferase
VVSIITPYHNTGELFVETAQTVFGQSLQQWEWLIVNDGSDEPAALRTLDRYRQQDPRLQVIDLPTNQGPSAARNTALRQARASLVFFLDSDDLIEPTTLEKTAWCLESYPEFAFSKGLTVHFGAQQFLGTVSFEAGKVFLTHNMITPRCMVRRDAALSVGGFDETLTEGLEDWDFWLRCASKGMWGTTVPEFLDWYRRREKHSESWAAWTGKGEQAMRRRFRRRYPALYAGKFPPLWPQPLRPYAGIRDALPFANRLVKERRRFLLIVPWMATGGSDKFTLDLIQQLTGRGVEVTVATTLPGSYAWYQEFAKLTPDIFILPHFLRLTDFPRFLHYLMQSRQIDLVLVSHSEAGYSFVNYLRARSPETAFVDYCHIVEEYWNNGGYPRQSVAYQEYLDLTVVSSQNLKNWMVARGANPSRIEVCYTNVDAQTLSPDQALRDRVRAELGITAAASSVEGEGETPVVLFAGRLCPQKQPRVLARVLDELRTRKVPFVCLVAGDGEDRRWLAGFLRRRHLTNQVQLLGTASHQRVQELLAASDVFFLPSMMEGISLAVYEAMAMAVVPVSADVGGQSELVTPDCGVLIPRGDEESEVAAYADVLERLLRSPQLRRSLGQAARDRVCSKFRIEDMGTRMDGLLEQAQQVHRTRTAPETGLSLATEHATMAIEYRRLAECAASLWKYGRLELAVQQVTGSLAPWGVRWRAFLWRSRNRRPLLGRFKDAIWIHGHRIKVRLLRLEEDE